MTARPTIDHVREVFAEAVRTAAPGPDRDQAITDLVTTIRRRLPPDAPEDHPGVVLALAAIREWTNTRNPTTPKGGAMSDNTNREHEQMNEAIRGVPPEAPPPDPESTSDPQTGAPDTSELERLRANAAAEAGLSLEWGRWLRGETVEDVLADAKHLAEVVAKHRARQQGGIGGGVRWDGRMPPPTFESVFRAQLEDQSHAVRRRAVELDQNRWMNGRHNRGGDDA